MPVLNIRSFADVRALLYTLLPVASTALVGYGVLDDKTAPLWIGLATAILGPVMAFVFARNVNTGRAAFHALLAAIQAILIGYGLVSDADVTLWVPVLVSLFGFLTGGVASANTPTTLDVEPTSVVDREIRTV